MTKAVVLLSSGLDSTVNLALCLKQYEVAMVLTFDYGQRAADREITQAEKICDHYSCAHKVIQLPWLKAITKTSLVNREMAVPMQDEVQIHNHEQSMNTAAAVWVPNRNGVFLNVAASFAEVYGAQWVIPGFNIEEAQTFADNSQEFLNALDESFRFSTQNLVQTKCFTTELNKTEIVKKALELKVPLHLVWPCYFSQEEICQSCESCQRFLNALAQNGLQYENLF